jgi:hypothetical protein
MTFWIASAVLFSAVAQEELTQQEMEDYDLNVSFAATLYYDGGKVVEVTGFHLGTDKYRHKFFCGVNQSFMVSLKSIKEVRRVRRGTNQYELVFYSDVTMTTVWDEADSRRLLGTLPDGTPWEGTIAGLRLVKLRIMEENTVEQGEEKPEDQDPG